MTTEPPLTVGLPVYNGERYLARTLAALQAQEFTDFKVIIGDNASTDATEEIIRSYTAVDSRFVYVRREQNIGAAANQNALARAAGSEFFCWQAADDLPYPGFYASTVRNLRENPDVVAASGLIEIIDEDDRVLRVEYERARVDSPDVAVRFADLASFDLHFCQYTFGVYRHSALMRTRLQLPFWTSDRLLMVELGLLGPFVRDPRPLFRIRDHQERITYNHKGSTGRRYVMGGPSRGVTYRYWRELRRAIDRTPLTADDRARVLRAHTAWTAHNAPKLARSVAGRMLDVVNPGS
jgi:glycosyltransferase involved in cell wall biosynthesis